MIVIAIEGGLVQSVSSDDPAEQGKAVVVIDYDAEGADPEEIEKVPQGENETEDAVVSRHEIGVLFAPVGEFLKAVPLMEARVTTCTQCGKPYFVEGNGVSHHASGNGPDGIDHDLDADHVPYGESRAPSARTGLASTYERGDTVETPFGEATIETDPDDHGRCKIRVAAFDEKENPVSATTVQFGRIIRKWNAKGKPEERKP